MSHVTQLEQRSVRQRIEGFLEVMHASRLLPGLMISMVLVALMLIHPATFAELGELGATHADGLVVTETEPQEAEPVVSNPLSPKMRAALDFVARKYRVSAEVLEPVFLAAQRAGQEARLDPLLIVAVISIESRFNPYAESGVGAQGLMQVMPQWHQDKIPAGMGTTALFDPETNVRVGAQVLRESIRREGSLIAGLQQFAGASDDTELVYANKVMAEKQQIEMAIGRGRKSGGAVI